MTTQTEDILAPEPVTIRFGAKTYKMLYTFKSLAFVQSRHTADPFEFFKDYTFRAPAEAMMTVVLAGALHKGLDEDTLVDLIGDDFEGFESQVNDAFEQMIHSFRWRKVIEFLRSALESLSDDETDEQGDDESGEAQAAEAAAPTPGPETPGSQPSTSPSPTSA